MTIFNRIKDPHGEYGTLSSSGWNSNNATTYPTVFDTTRFRSGIRSLKSTRTTSGLNTAIGSITFAPSTNTNPFWVAVTSGETISLGIYMWSPQVFNGRIAYSVRDANNVTIGTSPQGPLMSGLPANQWNLIKWEGVSIPTDPTISYILPSAVASIATTAVGGETVWYDDAMLVSGSTLPPFFAGDSPGCYWVGDPNASESGKPTTLLPKFYPVTTNRAPDPSVESGVAGAQGSSNGTLWPPGYDTTVQHSGTRSVLQTRAASSPSNQIGGAYMCGINGLNPAASTNVQVTPGEVLSYGVWVRCDQPNWRWNLAAFFRDANNSNLPIPTTATYDAQLPNQWTWATFSNILVPATAVVFSPRVQFFLANGVNSVGGEKSWADDCIIVSGSLAPDAYFDGNSPGCSWTGTPHQSASIRPINTPWRRWNGTTEENLAPSLWTGTAEVPVDLRDVITV